MRLTDSIKVIGAPALVPDVLFACLASRALHIALRQPRKSCELLEKILIKFSLSSESIYEHGSEAFF